MGQFIEGIDRHQAMLLPECLNDYVGEDSAVRAIDAFVEMLDLAVLGFSASPAATGRPGYHPGLMLRIYLYGYLNQVQSSRRLERECGRNLELIWRTGRLKPDFKTIADFRRDNGPAIRKVCQQFVALCRDINLLDGTLVAIDGSRFKAVNAKAKNYTRGKLRQKLGEIDKAIERYLGELDRADEVFEQTGTVLPEARMERTLRKLEHLQKEACRYRSIERRMDETGEAQGSRGDPDARSMATTYRMPRVVRNNVQTAVEADNHLIVAHEVSSRANYNRRLKNPIKPGGASGITIGIGYDLGYQKLSEFRQHWGGLLSNSDMQALERCLGATRSRASNLLRSVRHISISYEAAMEVFVNCVKLASVRQKLTVGELA